MPKGKGEITLILDKQEDSVEKRWRLLRKVTTPLRDFGNGVARVERPVRDQEMGHSKKSDVIIQTLKSLILAQDERWRHA